MPMHTRTNNPEPTEQTILIGLLLFPDSSGMDTHTHTAAGGLRFIPPETVLLSDLSDQSMSIHAPSYTHLSFVRAKSDPFSFPGDNRISTPSNSQLCLTNSHR